MGATQVECTQALVSSSAMCYQARHVPNTPLGQRFVNTPCQHRGIDFLLRFYLALYSVVSIHASTVVTRGCDLAWLWTRVRLCAVFTPLSLQSKTGFVKLRTLSQEEDVGAFLTTTSLPFGTYRVKSCFPYSYPGASALTCFQDFRALTNSIMYVYLYPGTGHCETHKMPSGWCQAIKW